MRKNKYFSLETHDNKASLYVYGDITSSPWNESDVSSHNLSKQLEELKGIENIDVFINSYGGEVAEGIAIYNALKRFKGKVTTYVDGFACSIASVIFMAGDERVMNENSLLLIHNAWSSECGDANTFRKVAEDLDKINELSIGIYLEKISLSREELQEYLDKETWISSSEALEYGFATRIEKEETENASQSYKSKMIKALLDKEVKEMKSITISVDENGELIVTPNDGSKVNEPQTDDGTTVSTPDSISIDDNQDDLNQADDSQKDIDGDDIGTSDDENKGDTSTADTDNDGASKSDEDDEDNSNNEFKEKLLKVFKGGR